jgi:uncharacterized membrane protein required for colicin V production
MALSGFRRGFVFYAIDLVGFVGAVVAAVRFHEVPAAAADVLGVPPRASAAAGGLAIFVPLIVLTAIVGRKIGRAVYAPGLYTANRVMGAAFAAALGASVVVVGLLFARAAALPFDLLDRSLLAPRIVGAALPVVDALDDRLGLELCGGRLARAVSGICD